MRLFFLAFFGVAILYTVVFFSSHKAEALSLGERFSGYILLDVDQHGRAWYVLPGEYRRYDLARPDTAFAVMRLLSVGVTNADLSRIPIADSGALGDMGMREKLRGRIILQVEEHGEAWYVHSQTMERHYLGRPADAFAIMGEQGLGITSSDLSTIPLASDPILSDVQGRIVLDVQQDGAAWYVHPSSGERHYLGRPADAFAVMREQGVGISNANLERIPLAGSSDVGDVTIVNAVRGYIVLQVEEHGEAWYVHPLSGQRFFLGRPADAFAVMREQGLGIEIRELIRLPIHLEGLESASFSAVWVNTGDDKIPQEDTPYLDGKNVHSAAWDGTTISLFGAKNEVISFNMIVEAGASSLQNVTVSFDTLIGPNGYCICSRARSSDIDDVFDWTERDIELFYTRYLEIKGLSRLSYDTYDEDHIPNAFQRSDKSKVWKDRPDANKHYPEIAVPLELVPTFNVQKGTSQSVWADVYLPDDAPAGEYTGTVIVRSGNGDVRTIPITVEVLGFTLPDEPASKTMIHLGYSVVNNRYTGVSYPNDGTAAAAFMRTVYDRHFQIAHRHKLSLIGSEDGWRTWEKDQPRPRWQRALTGELFTSSHGYDGPGVGEGNGVYSIGTYGSWGWKNQGEAAMRSHLNGYADWFRIHAPSAEVFLYLIDESDDYDQIQQWSKWINANPGSGKKVKSFATVPATFRSQWDTRNDPASSAHQLMPGLDIVASWIGLGVTRDWNIAAEYYEKTSGKSLYLYNGKRPASGSFATEDDAIALRELAWGQYKKGIDRWFFWESTYYNNYQAGEGETNVFSTAATFGGRGSFDPILGETGWNHSNGDGVLFYPGTDRVFPDESYGLAGPIVSYRLKHWRRGVQDVDYLVKASSINAVATERVVRRMVPKVLWEVDTASPTDDPQTWYTWTQTDPSWPTDGASWEAARRELANIILDR